MGRAVGAEAVAVRRERPVPAPLEHLQHRLLEEAVQDGGHPELPSASPWLGNLDPLHRLRLVGTLEQLRPEGWPVFREVARQLLDGHPVHSRTPLVGLDTSQCCRQVCTLDDLLHHLVGVGRAFGCARRRGRFGPFPCRRRSFTLLSCREGQVDLAFLPPAAHEMRPPTDRSLYPLAGTVRAFGDVRPSGVPGAFPSPTIPVADFCPGHHRPSPSGQSRVRDPEQISRGKLDRRPRTTAGFTFCALDGYGLCGHTPARPARTPRIRFLSIDPRVCSPLPSDGPSRGRPCGLLPLHLHQVGERTCTSKLSNMLGTREQLPPGRR